LIGRQNSSHAEDRTRLMDCDAITELKEEGVTFGSHTMTHPFLSRLPADRLGAELTGSKAYLEDRLRLPVDFFCYPYGDYDSATVAAAKQAGYRLAVTTKRGRVRAGDDPLQVRRSFIRAQTNPFLYLLRLHSGYEDRKRGG
ncbi:MAG: polysaccharide deacetylase family protein, partial [Nitrospiraceae bacterium]|nr:polysaccharide deacetylase family protein [Nitrospiraceae bacterium]